MIPDVFEVRRLIGDPVTSDFTLVEELPDYALQNTAYTTGNGEYHYYDRLGWHLYTLKFGDAYIKILVEKLGKLGAAVKLINNLIAQIDPTDYINSGNAGGQSMSFPSLQDVMDYYNTLKENLLEEQAAENGTNSGLMMRTKKRPIGGVLEYE